MNIQEIKQAIAEGKKVYWSNLAYEVILDSKGQYLIKSGSHCIGLTWADGITLNGKEEDFFIHQPEEKPQETEVENTEISIQKLKAIMTRKHSELFKTFGLFFAFTDKQFEENKTPIKEGAKYIHVGGNGYLPEYNVEDFKKGMEDINQWYNAETSKEGMRDKLIAHELINYECYYVGSIEDALDALGEGFTAEEVQAVFNKNYQQYMEDNG